MWWVREFVKYARRVVLSVLGAALAVFIAIELSISGGFRATLLPGGVNPENERDVAIAERFDLNGNLIERYLRWIWRAVQGDFGDSTRGTTPVWDLVTPRLSITGELMVVSVVVALAVGVPVGLLAAAWAGRRRGRAVDSVLSVSQSLPVFVSAPILVWIFAVELRWLPAASWVRISDSFGEHLEHLILPVAAIALSEFGAVGRIVRADTVRMLEEDFVTSAVSKGLTKRFILFRHAFRPASLGLLNVVALNIGSMLAGTIIIEVIFGIGGLGQLLFQSTINRDLHLLLALTTYLVFVFVTLNSIVDVVMRTVDPRISKS